MAAVAEKSAATLAAKEIVGTLIARARAAQQVYEGYDQMRVDEVVTAAGWAIVKPENNRRLAELAVLDTGLGNV
ncbi:MAG: sulfoacetaldehyde dehydrogenase, partial [Proteobacteria bacterium]|nr:sulfoacetaldehyde dehydrogenase [Pseudomonadota bacterium]